MCGVHLHKLDDCPMSAVFNGYEWGAKTCRFYDPVIRHAVVSQDAVFDESASWSWEQEHTGLGNDLVVEYRALQLESELLAAPLPR
jgi:hypothetical protein